MTPVEFLLVRDLNHPSVDETEGFCLGKIYGENIYLGESLEDEDRRLEEGNEKVYGRTAMPTGRFELVLYDSPKHGLVPLFVGVPKFSYTEIHGANNAKQLLGCVAVGTVRTSDGVADCKKVVNRIIEIMQRAKDEGRKCFCTIKREGE